MVNMRVVFAFLIIQLHLMREHITDTVAGLFSLVVYAVISIIIFKSLSDAWYASNPSAIYQILAIAGVLRIAWGFAETITENFWVVGPFAKTGQLVFFIISPLPTLVHLLLHKIHYERLVDVAVGIGFIYFSYKNNIFVNFDLANYFSLILLGVMSAILFFSITLIGASSCVLWLSESSQLMTAAGQLAELGMYPARLFVKITGETSLIVIPVFSFSLFFDGHIFGSVNASITALISPLFFVILAFALWHHAIASYEGTGS